LDNNDDFLSSSSSTFPRKFVLAFPLWKLLCVDVKLWHSVQNGLILRVIYLFSVIWQTITVLEIMPKHYSWSHCHHCRQSFSLLQLLNLVYRV